MRTRHFFLPLAAIVITGLCMYRATRPPRPVVEVERGLQRAFPPKGWELPDHEFRLVKFDRYLGRQSLVVYFFDAAQLETDEPVLTWLRDHADEIYDQGWRIIAISGANPAVARKVAERDNRPWPFPILTDVELRNPAPTPVHHLWSRVDRATGQLRPGLFLVDRLGYIRYRDGRPVAEADPMSSLKALIDGH
ncbi:MAG: peroxiredoxin family protein [Planctomycetaceae bacterium]